MLKGKVAIITGGTRGIGYETVKQFLENGAKVALLGSRSESVEQAIKSLKNINENYDVIGFYPNLANPDEIEKTFETINNTFGHIDILVNNAGISSATKIEDYTENEINKILDINIKAVFYCSKAIVKYLKLSKGVIINASSMVSFYGQKSGCLYSMSKFAINGLTKSLSRELAPFSIRVNAVAPGIINTDMLKNLSDDLKQSLELSIPLKRLGEALDIANAYVFLASDKASYITGTILQVDGAVIS